MSESRTSWIAVLGLVLAVPFLRYLRRSRSSVALRLAVVLVAGLGSVAFLVLQYADAGLEAVGRDTTFSGRTDIWEAAAAAGMENPILGPSDNLRFGVGRSRDRIRLFTRFQVLLKSARFHVSA